MRIERVGRIVGGADDGDAKRAQDAHGSFRSPGAKLFVAAVENIPNDAVRGVERLFDAERAGAEFHGRPVVERIAERARNRPGPGFEFLPIVCVASDQPFGDAHGPHGSPLVMVAIEPDFGDGTEAVVGRHELRRQVAMVIDDWQVAGEVVIEIARRFGFEQKIVSLGIRTYQFLLIDAAGKKTAIID